MKHSKMKSKEFFEEMREGSEVKTEIVRKYFWAWAKILSGQVKKQGGKKIAFVDLFAGKGRYDDGAPSTPILILEEAIRDKTISQMLEAYFNDADPDNVRALEAAIAAVPGINTLKYKPIVRNHLVDDALADKLTKWSIPALFFLDPFGYKGLSRKLIEAALRPWGCDCIFFFNYNRINAALSNLKFTANMHDFFGEERANRLRANLEGEPPEKRQQIIIDELKGMLAELGGVYNIEYYFKDEHGRKTSHFIIFASKNVLGYDIMKSIMGGESSKSAHGVPSFGFSPLHKKQSEDRERAPTLFEMEPDPIDHLAEMLLMAFAGRTLTTNEIYREHHVGRPYLLRNYQDALKRLDSEGRILTEPPASQRRAGTFGENVKVTFPAEEEI